MTSHIDQGAVGTGRIRIDRNRLQNAVGRAAFSLHRRRAVKAPQRKLFQRRERFEFLDLGLTAEIRYRSVTIEPEKVEGLGGGFQFMNLDTELFDAHGLINDDISYTDLARYIFFSATKLDLPTSPLKEGAGVCPQIIS